MTVNAELQRRAARLVSQEVNACMSSLVATLASGFDSVSRSLRDLSDLTERAYELTVPLNDYESAAREAGAKLFLHEDGPNAGKWVVLDQPEDSDMWSTFYDDAHHCGVAFCDWHSIEPHELEVYEHWAVSPWLAEKLDAKGERVDTDFAGLNVWARTTTGQAISADSVIVAIATDLEG